MTHFDLILNLAGLLLWLSWCGRHLDPLARSTPATLVGTVRRAEPRRLAGWQWLAGLVLLLGARGLLYLQIGSAAGWTPKLDLGVVVLAFRNDQATSVQLYSLLSLVRVWAIFYFWLLTLVLVNWSVPEPDPLLKLLRLHLGRLNSKPWPVVLLLPVLCLALGWGALHPLLAHMGVVASATALTQVLAQSLLLALMLVLSLKYMLPVILVLHLLASYVYLGSSPLWDFIASSSRNLLRPIKRVPLQFGKVDLRGAAGALLVLLLLHWIPEIVESYLKQRSLVIWPH
jgi:uncharacterized protein YggT (Ycf19 family)